MKQSTRLLSILICTLLVLACSKRNHSISIYAEPDIPQIQFAVDELIDVLEEKGIAFQITDSKDADVLIVANPNMEGIKEEGFELAVGNENIQITAAAAAGAMYGVLELAEQIKIGGLEGVVETTRTP